MTFLNRFSRVLSSFPGFFSKKLFYIGEFVLFSTISNHTIPGIVLSGDPLYILKLSIFELEKRKSAQNDHEKNCH